MNNPDLQKIVTITDQNDNIIKNILLQSILIEYIFKHSEKFPEDIIKMNHDGQHEILSINPKYTIKL